jgi:cytoskeletal protein RodZ
MSGIGTRLREERVRRGLEIDEVEAETRIRAKYLLALEDERFDVLPGDAYARAFLRDYAEELGLDAQEMVDELNEMREPPPAAPLTPQPSVDPITSPWEGRRRAVGLAITAVVAVAVAVAAGLALVGALNGNSNAAGGPGGGSTPPSRTSSPAGSTTPASTSGVTSPPPSGGAGGGHHAARLALAASGPCWIQVREGSSSGQVLYSGMLAAGQTRHFRHVPVWIRVGAPWDLVLKVRGHQVPWPISGVGNVLVTSSGVTAA